MNTKDAHETDAQSPNTGLVIEESGLANIIDDTAASGEALIEAYVKYRATQPATNRRGDEQNANIARRGLNDNAARSIEAIVNNASKSGEISDSMIEWLRRQAAEVRAGRLREPDEGF